MEPPVRVQLQLRLPYKFEPTASAEVRRLLADGYHVEQIQRLSDQEVLIMLVRPAA